MLYPIFEIVAKQYSSQLSGDFSKSNLFFAKAELTKNTDALMPLQVLLFPLMRLLLMFYQITNF